MRDHGEGVDERGEGEGEEGGAARAGEGEEEGAVACVAPELCSLLLVPP